jgi:hypothetical protein
VAKVTINTKAFMAGILVVRGVMTMASFSAPQSDINRR